MAARGRPRKDAQLAPIIPIRKRAKTPEGREQQMVAAAIDLAERQIHEGTAAAQVITHYLKLGSSREKLEQERLARENILLEKKTEALESAARVEELYIGALNAMRSYQGQPPIEMEEDGEVDVYDD
jgi:hypothetical protein